MKTSIIILTHNQLEVTKQCLDSIRKHTPEEYELIVVDNCSTDGTAEYLKTQSDIKTVFNTANLGFAKGCNQGVEISSGENVLFLNNDTVVTKNWLGNMLYHLYSNNKIGMVGPVTNNISGHQQIQVTYQDMSSLDAFAEGHCKWNSKSSRRVLRLVGFCLLAKKSVLDDIGLFDERYGLGNYEDDDLCLRAVKKGWHLLIALDSFIHHIGSVTFITSLDTRTRNLLAENKQKAVDKWGFDIAPYLFNGKPGISVTLCMVVKDAGETLERCLNSVKELVDEIIIIDLGLDDLTKEIAKKYTPHVYHFTSNEDNASARNFSMSFSSMEYILWLDAEDIFLEEDRKKFLSLKNNLDLSVDVVSMCHNVVFDENGFTTLSIWNPHLIKRSRNFLWIDDENEYLAVGGKIIKSNIAITYQSSTIPPSYNLELYKRQLSQVDPPTLFFLASKFVEQGEHEKAITLYKKFLNTGRGWLEDNILACGRIANCYNHLKDHKNEHKYIYKSFEYDSPRAEFCCLLGFNYLNLGDYQKASFWYKLAATVEKPLDNYGLIYSCWTWLPHLQLCICYDRLGMYSDAYSHNEIARTYLPNDPNILHNKKYLETILKPLEPEIEETITNADDSKKQLTFVTLFPETENVHLSKDVGMIPYILRKHFNLDARVACYENGEYPYLLDLVNGLKLDFIEKQTGNPTIDASAYLRENAKNIDILNLYHLLDRSLEWAKIYKSLNPEGKIYLKLDTNEWYIKQFDINEINVNGTHKVLKDCDLISVETKELYDYLNSTWPLKVNYVPNGFYDNSNRATVNYQEKENIICTVGRIGLPIKANEILLQAFKIASPFLPNWKLKLIGPVEKEFENYLEGFFSEGPQLREKIIITGEIIDKTVLEKEYRKAKIFCLSSRLESFGLVFAEAASNGCFIITSDVISANDVTDHGKYGDIFKKDNIPELVHLLIKNCHDEARLEKNCKGIQDFAYKNFYWVDICKDILDGLSVEIDSTSGAEPSTATNLLEATEPSVVIQKDKKMKYHFNIDMSHYNSLTVILRNIKPKSRVLEFGPATGYMTQYMKEVLNCSVVCIEIDEDAAKLASQYSEKMIVSDIDNSDWAYHLKGEAFDHMVFADVLEHLKYPERALKTAAQFLKENGTILTSIPNIAHNAIIMELLQGRFDYRPLGLLDESHLRFFTRKSITNLFEKTGLEPLKWFPICLLPEQTELAQHYENFPESLRNLLQARDDACVYQYVTISKRKLS